MDSRAAYCRTPETWFGDESSVKEFSFRPKSHTYTRIIRATGMRAPRMRTKSPRKIPKLGLGAYRPLNPSWIQLKYHLRVLPRSTFKQHFAQRWLTLVMSGPCRCVKFLRCKWSELHAEAWWLMQKVSCSIAGQGQRKIHTGVGMQRSTMDYREDVDVSVGWL